jgi:hypothetical protein
VIIDPSSGNPVFSHHLTERTWMPASAGMTKASIRRFFIASLDCHAQEN